MKARTFEYQTAEHDDDEFEVMLMSTADLIVPEAMAARRQNIENDQRIMAGKIIAEKG